MKIQKIGVKNFKAIAEKEINFGGCSAIITAGNNAGKTSLLRGLIDRMRGERPEIIIKEGETNGFNFIELNDGSIIEWKFTEKTESFSFTTKEGIKQTQGVLSSIGERYFGKKFDIDKFLNATQKAQTKELQSLVGLDFTAIDERFKIAYEKRTDQNKEVARLLAMGLKAPVKIEAPDVEALKGELNAIKETNAVLLSEWEINNLKHQNDIIAFNSGQDILKESIEQSAYFRNMLLSSLDSIFGKCVNIFEVNRIFDALEKPAGKKELTNLEKPTLNSTVEIENKIAQAQENLRAFDAYSRDLVTFNDWVKKGKEARELQLKLDAEVKAIEKERADLISSANLPAEFTIVENTVFYNGLPLSDNQQSSSAKYIAALKLGAMVLGEVKTMHFDASFLDKNSLAQIESWASENELQLLIERPDFDGGEICFKII